MEVQLIGLQRARNYWSEAEKPTNWESTPYLVTFSVRGCRAPLQEVIDVVENLDGMALDRCIADDSRYLITVEVAGENWRPAAHAMTKALARLPELARKPSAEDLLELDVMELEVGYALIKLVDAAKGGDLLNRIAMIRRQIATELGLVVPPIRIRDNPQLPPNDYTIKIRGQAVAKGGVFPDQLLAMDSGSASGPLPGGSATIEPAFGMSAYWITESLRPEAEQLNYTVIEPSSVLATHLTEVIKSHGWELLTRQETQNLLDFLRARTPALIDEVIPALIKPNDLKKLLQNLLRERVPVRDLETILEAITDHAGCAKDLDLLTEHVRCALARTLCKMHVDDQNKLWCVTLAPAVEALIKAGGAGAMPVASALQIMEQISAAIPKLTDAGRQAVVLCNSKVRLLVRQMLERALPQVAVLSFNELMADVSVEAVAMVEMP